jgi:hypothetical protein
VKVFLSVLKRLFIVWRFFSRQHGPPNGHLLVRHVRLGNGRSRNRGQRRFRKQGDRREHQEDHRFVGRRTTEGFYTEVSAKESKRQANRERTTLSSASLRSAQS